MVLNSFRKVVDIMVYPPKLLVNPTLNNYIKTLIQSSFLKYGFNSILVAVISVSIGLAAGLPAAYAISRHRLKIVASVILGTRMLPPISYLIPWFILFKMLKSLDTYRALISAHLVLTLPLTIWLMVGFFDEVSMEYSDAAMIDGCTKFGAFIHAILPMTMPGVASTAVLIFTESWNNFLFALVLSADKTRTLPVTIFNFIGWLDVDVWGMYAASTLMVAPLFLIALFAQESVLRGFMGGGIKS